MTEPALLTWTENDRTISRRWISESHHSLPKKILVADDRLTADSFYDQASQGAAFIWRGDFQNAKQLLQAVQRRIDKNAKRKSESTEISADLFHRYRQAQAHKAQLLGRLLICLEANLSIQLPRAPDFKQALNEAIGAAGEGVISLRELLGINGAFEWRKNGVSIAALGAKVHPHYGLFSPGRGEYLDLVNQAPLNNGVDLAFDIGTGTGVIAALLAKRGIKAIVATDNDPRAIVCAQENVKRLMLDKQIQILKTDLFPSGTADLIVCNPPWLPARATSRVERAIYDEDSQMLRGFLAGAADHLTKAGEVWLIMSNLSELLGLRKPDDLGSWIQAAGLTIVDQLKTMPQHSKAKDSADLLFAARSKEVTSLWRLRASR